MTHTGMGMINGGHRKKADDEPEKLFEINQPAPPTVPGPVPPGVTPAPAPSADDDAPQPPDLSLNEGDYVKRRDRGGKAEIGVVQEVRPDGTYIMNFNGSLVQYTPEMIEDLENITDDEFAAERLKDVSKEVGDLVEKKVQERGIHHKVRSQGMDPEEVDSEATELADEISSYMDRRLPTPGDIEAPLFDEDAPGITDMPEAQELMDADADDTAPEDVEAEGEMLEAPEEKPKGKKGALREGRDVQIGDIIEIPQDIVRAESRERPEVTYPAGTKFRVTIVGPRNVGAVPLENGWQTTNILDEEYQVVEKGASQYPFQVSEGAQRIGSEAHLRRVLARELTANEIATLKEFNIVTLADLWRALESMPTMEEFQQTKTEYQGVVQQAVDAMKADLTAALERSDTEEHFMAEVAQIISSNEYGHMKREILDHARQMWAEVKGEGEPGMEAAPAQEPMAVPARKRTAAVSDEDEARADAEGILDSNDGDVDRAIEDARNPDPDDWEWGDEVTPEYIELVVQKIQEIADERETEYRIENEPGEDDILIGADYITAFYAGNRILRVDERDELYPAIKEWMEKNQYYPDVWQIGERGDVMRVTSDIMDIGREAAKREAAGYNLKPGQELEAEREKMLDREGKGEKKSSRERRAAWDTYDDDPSQPLPKALDFTWAMGGGWWYSTPEMSNLGYTNNKQELRDAGFTDEQIEQAQRRAGYGRVVFSSKGSRRPFRQGKIHGRVRQRVADVTEQPLLGGGASIDARNGVVSAQIEEMPVVGEGVNWAISIDAGDYGYGDTEISNIAPQRIDDGNAASVDEAVQAAIAALNEFVTDTQQAKRYAMINSGDVESTQEEENEASESYENWSETYNYGSVGVSADYNEIWVQSEDGSKAVTINALADLPKIESDIQSTISEVEAQAGEYATREPEPEPEPDRPFRQGKIQGRGKRQRTAIGPDWAAEGVDYPAEELPVFDAGKMRRLMETESFLQSMFDSLKASNPKSSDDEILEIVFNSEILDSFDLREVYKEAAVTEQPLLGGGASIDARNGIVSARVEEMPAAGEGVNWIANIDAADFEDEGSETGDPTLGETKPVLIGQGTAQSIEDAVRAMKDSFAKFMSDMNAAWQIVSVAFEIGDKEYSEDDVQDAVDSQVNTDVGSVYLSGNSLILADADIGYSKEIGIGMMKPESLIAYQYITDDKYKKMDGGEVVAAFIPPMIQSLQSDIDATVAEVESQAGEYATREPEPAPEPEASTEPEAQGEAGASPEDIAKYPNISPEDIAYYRAEGYDDEDLERYNEYRGKSKKMRSQMGLSAGVLKRMARMERIAAMRRNASDPLDLIGGEGWDEIDPEVWKNDVAEELSRFKVNVWGLDHTDATRRKPMDYLQVAGWKLNHAYEKAMENSPEIGNEIAELKARFESAVQSIQQAEAQGENSMQYYSMIRKMPDEANEIIRKIMPSLLASQRTAETQHEGDTPKEKKEREKRKMGPAREIQVSRTESPSGALTPTHDIDGTAYDMATALTTQGRKREADLNVYEISKKVVQLIEEDPSGATYRDYINELADQVIAEKGDDAWSYVVLQRTVGDDTTRSILTDLLQVIRQRTEREGPAPHIKQWQEEMKGARTAAKYVAQTQNPAVTRTAIRSVGGNVEASDKDSVTFTIPDSNVKARIAKIKQNSDAKISELKEAAQNIDERGEAIPPPRGYHEWLQKFWKAYDKYGEYGGFGFPDPQDFFDQGMTPENAADAAHEKISAEASQHIPTAQAKVHARLVSLAIDQGIPESEAIGMDVHALADATGISAGLK